MQTEQIQLARLVRPRVFDSLAGSEPVLLEDALERRVERRQFGPLLLEGAPGSGRRTALAYVRELFAGRAEIEIGERASARDRECLRLALTDQGELVQPRDRRLALAPWRRDEWIEYLLANHHDACASVMRRLEDPERYLALGGSAFLWTLVLDELARDAQLADDLAALRGALPRRFSNPAALAGARTFLLEALTGVEDDAPLELARLQDGEPDARALLELKTVRLLLGAEGIVQVLLDPERRARLPRRCPSALLRVLGPLLRERPEVRAELERRLGEDEPELAACAAALLHRLGPTVLSECIRTLRRRPGPLPALNYAELPAWHALALDLSGLHMACARLPSSLLDGANLTEAMLARSDLSGSSLRSARLARLHANGARFGSADLRECVLDDAHLASAHLDGARLEGASLRRAHLENADLRDALLDSADLSDAVLRGARVHGASFDGTDLTRAALDGVDLRSARLATRKLAGASLAGCFLDALTLEAPDLSGANLSDALLTGTRLLHADLHGAKLCRAGLAHVEWPDANLQGADLTHASFQLGSSRSGVVGVAPASWSTRTGFYADEFTEQSFKAPEEIRKADLRRADLRGALIQDTDFYLVDLRGAVYTPEQGRHLRACGAIL